MLIKFVSARFNVDRCLESEFASASCRLLKQPQHKQITANACIATGLVQAACLDRFLAQSFSSYVASPKLTKLKKLEIKFP